MVVAKNIGRLGNNLFQIAAAIGYCSKYKNYHWAADFQPGVGEPFSKIHEVYPNLPKFPLSGARYHEHPHGHCDLHKTTFDQCHFNYHPIPDLGPDVTLTGFFQSYRYFENAEEEIRKVFGLPHWIEYEDYISIHVRRGDYVQHPNSFPPITVDYLNRAIDHFGRSQKYIVFSDDIGWCSDNLKGDCFEFSTGRSERQDMEIQASCKHHIIANSTFSWWAAWLGHNPRRTVITPSCVRGNWFGINSGVRQDVVDLLPKEWIQIQFR